MAKYKTDYSQGVIWGCIVAWIVLTVFQLQLLFYTTLIFHDIYESIFGILVGYFVIVVIFQENIFSDALYSIVFTKDYFLLVNHDYS